MHPDKCKHPKAGDAAATLNTVRCGEGGGRERAAVHEATAAAGPPAAAGAALTPSPRRPLYHIQRQAWDTLSNPIKKAAYDAYGARALAEQSRGAPVVFAHEAPPTLRSASCCAPPAAALAPAAGLAAPATRLGQLPTANYLENLLN